MEGNKILEGLINLAASTGAACHEKSVKLSHVLSAMGVSPDMGMGTMRFSLGRGNNLDQITEAARLIIERVNYMRK